MRPAIEIATQICGCADARQRKADIALIEADRAELVAEIVAWLDDPAGDWPRATSHAANLAHQIEAKFGGKP